MKISCTLVLGLLLSAAGCGYSFVQPQAVPADIVAVRVAAVDVGDGDPLLGDALGRQLRRELRRARRFEVVEQGERADAVLKVSVVTDRSRAVAFDEFDSVLDYQMTIAADARLDRRDGQTVWKRERISSSRGHAAVASAVVTSSAAFHGDERMEVDALPAFDDVQLGEERRAVARERLAEDLALRIYSYMTEGL